MGLRAKSSGAPTVGVNIGTSLIKVVEARPGKTGVQITALGVAPTPPGTIEHEVVVDPQTLGQAIRRLIQESGITCKRSVSSVSGQSSVVVRIIEVPKMTKQELGETMKWEVERHVPFAANEVVMDFQPIERPTTAPDDQNMEVLLAVAQQEVINSHLEALFAAGLDPVVIDVEPLAICRALIDASPNGARSQTVAVINIGAAVTDMAVFQNGLLTFPRILPIAGDAITRALSDGLNISLAQAESLKRERAAVLLDRAASFSPSMEFESPPAGEDQIPADATIGMAAPPGEPDAADDVGFIPGLGFGYGAPSESPAPENAMPDFDVDLGGAPPGTGLDLGEPEDASLGSPEPKLDLSEPAGGLGGPDVGQAAPSDVSASQIAAFTDEQVYDAIAPMLHDLIVEIRRSLEYYASRFQSQPDKILLCGGTSKMKDLDKLLESELGIPVAIGNPLENVSVVSRTLSQEYLDEIASVLTVGVGLAIRDMIGD